VVPAGGTTGQVLIKSSATDYALAWSGGPQSVVNYGTATINTTDAVTTYPFGITQNFLSNTQASTGGWPCGANYCQVLTMRTQDPAGFATSQWCLSDTNAMNFAYYRSGNQNGWSAWISVAADTGWKTLPIASGFIAYGSGPAPQYRVKDGMVYYRGQVAPSSGTWNTGTFAFVTALPAEAQPTLSTNGYVMCMCATGSNAVSHRLYISAATPATITDGVGTAGAAYVDLTGLTYPLG